MDDGYVVGPPEVVFPALDRFAVAISDLGLKLRLDKSACYCPSGGLDTCPFRPPECLVGQILGSDGAIGHGIIVGGVPVGDSLFVDTHLGRKCDKALNKVNTLTRNLRDVHLQSLFCVMHFAMSPLIDHWIQHSAPEAVGLHAERFDRALLDVACVCSPGLCTADETTLRRLRLPVRMYGIGLRSRTDLAPAAFLGTLCRTVPLMLDSLGPDGVCRQGFLPQLLQMFGAGSFDAGAEESRFAFLLSSGCSLGSALAVHWSALKAELGEHCDGALLTAASAAGAGIDKVQRNLTHLREAYRFRQLDHCLREQPAGDIARAAWLNLDKFSTAWVTCWPSRDAYLTNAEFGEVAARYLGLPSPACSAVIGERIAGTKLTVDAHGFRLGSASLAGDGWRTQRDCLKWRLVEDAKEMGVPVRAEVYGLFASCLPHAQRQHFDSMPARQRQGIVPDFQITVQWDSRGPARQLLLELKTLHFGVSAYPPATLARCGPVARRAEAIPREYAAKAMRLDTLHCGTAPGCIGPVQQRLLALGTVRGLVFGSWGEASPDVERLLSALVEAGALRHWRSMSAGSPEAARGAIAWLLRRRWGLAAVR
ncbi:unnamed protein product [Polarella glacialis]|uniref:Uncharacterized protein n=1 Tax=Polarella glacialis TaxID=89957 RepID=A0A813HZ37_POLGL|nr:unnamed protein product [Polarella glacialis]